MPKETEANKKLLFLTDGMRVLYVALTCPLFFSGIVWSFSWWFFKSRMEINLYRQRQSQFFRFLEVLFLARNAVAVSIDVRNRFQAP